MCEWQMRRGAKDGPVLYFRVNVIVDMGRISHGRLMILVCGMWELGSGVIYRPAIVEEVAECSILIMGEMFAPDLHI